MIVRILFAVAILGCGVQATMKNSLECIGCKAAVEFFRFIYGQNATRDAIINVASYVCEHFVKEESVVCSGLASQFREELLYVLGELILRPGQFCRLFVDNCGDSITPFADWNITLPPKSPEQQYPEYPSAKSQNLRVLQLSDVHLDEHYVPGSAAECSSPLCCQATSHAKGGLSEAEKAGYWGTVGSCDVPYWTVENMLQNINKTQKLDYIMLSGDYSSHVNWNYTKKDHVRVMRNLTTLMNKYFPTTPVFWALGNHEGVPVNSFAPHYIPKRYQPHWLYNQLWRSQRRWVGADSEKQIAYRGSYTAQLFNGLRLISLNTGYCETTNFWLYINQTDPDGTLSWLVSELSRAERDQQYVHILSHIPPGNAECLEGWAKNYYRIANRFSSTITGQFFGHIHADSFTVFYENMNDDTSTPTGVLYAAPSVTTFPGLNPAYRVYEIEPGMRYRVLDLHNYFLNLSLTEDSKIPEWDLLYSAKNEYNLPDMSATSWNRVIDDLTLNRSAFERFVRNSVRRDDYPCDSGCRLELLCALRSGHHNETLCAHLGPSLSSFSNYGIPQLSLPLREKYEIRVSNSSPTSRKHKSTKLIAEKNLKSSLWKDFYAH